MWTPHIKVDIGQKSRIARLEKYCQGWFYDGIERRDNASKSVDLLEVIIPRLVSFPTSSDTVNAFPSPELSKFRPLRIALLLVRQQADKLEDGEMRTLAKERKARCSRGCSSRHNMSVAWMFAIQDNKVFGEHALPPTPWLDGRRSQWTAG